MFYASAAMLFLGAFVMRYRLELILSFPLVALVMAIYLRLAFKPDSAVINPEKLYREPLLMAAVVVCAVLMLVLLFVDIPALDTVFRPTGLRVRGRPPTRSTELPHEHLSTPVDREVSTHAPAPATCRRAGPDR